MNARNFGVFQDSAVEKITLPSTLKTIHRGAFCGCRKLLKVELPEGLQLIGERAFAGSELSAIEFPKTLPRVERSAFEGTPLEARGRLPASLFGNASGK